MRSLQRVTAIIGKLSITWGRSIAHLQSAVNPPESSMSHSKQWSFDQNNSGKLNAVFWRRCWTRLIWTNDVAIVKISCKMFVEIVKNQCCIPYQLYTGKEVDKICYSILRMCSRKVPIIFLLSKPPNQIRKKTKAPLSTLTLYCLFSCSWGERRWGLGRDYFGHGLDVVEQVSPLQRHY